MSSTIIIGNIKISVKLPDDIRDTNISVLLHEMPQKHNKVKSSKKTDVFKPGNHFYPAPAFLRRQAETGMPHLLCFRPYCFPEAPFPRILLFLFSDSYCHLSKLYSFYPLFCCYFTLSPLTSHPII
jgi:hypothetical protein